MQWIREHKQVWRTTLLAFLLLGIMGPWWFDRIVVPSQYTCSSPFLRLDGDFCGAPMPGTWILLVAVTLPFDLVARLISGTIALPEAVSTVVGELAFIFLALVLVLPFLSTSLLILRGDRQRWQVIQMIAYGLAGGAALLLGANTSGRDWALVLWGNWLYVGGAASGLTLELLVSHGGKQAQQGI